MLYGEVEHDARAPRVADEQGCRAGADRVEKAEKVGDGRGKVVAIVGLAGFAVAALVQGEDAETRVQFRADEVPDVRGRAETVHQDERWLRIVGNCAPLAVVHTQ